MRFGHLLFHFRIVCKQIWRCTGNKPLEYLVDCFLRDWVTLVVVRLRYQLFAGFALQNER